MIVFTIYGNLPRKSNSRRIVRNRRTDKPMSIKSDEALEYEKSFLYQIPMQAKRYLSGSLILYAEIYYRSRRSDLSDELLCDLLQKAGVIKNDRDIDIKILFREIDRKNPKVMIWVAQREDIEWWNFVIGEIALRKIVRGWESKNRSKWEDEDNQNTRLE